MPSIDSSIPGYLLQQELFRSNRTVIYRGIREVDQTSVIIKTLNEAYPSAHVLSCFKHEFHITQKMHAAGIIRAYAQVPYGNNLALVLQDFQGLSLHDHFAYEGLFPIQVALRIAIELGKSLRHVHHQHVIHKDINPTNILVQRDTYQIQLIDFGIAIELAGETQDGNVTNKFEGPLAYISPEQTGRMNREMDYRTDYYSLGVTLYELFTGQLPFQAKNPLEWIYCHIAEIPPALSVANPYVPEPISAIVMKLMAKNAEDRYQSSAAFIRDFEECERQWQETGGIQPFAYAQHDISEKFHISQRLYGREAELETLLTVFDKVTGGHVEFLLVAGYSGIGKSSLVHEIDKPLVKQRGYFLQGKCEQFQKDIPYDCLIQAFRGLMRQLLTLPDTQIRSWKTQLLAALGPNGQVIIDVIPELAIIIGPQPPVPELGAMENQNRFNHTFQKFMIVLEQPEHPLVIFLDDLQWVDHATLDLIKVILGDPKSRYLYLIGAYRDNEVSASHPLISMVDRVAIHKGVHRLMLSPLSQSHVHQIISETLYASKESSSTLADLVYTKTQGNPFFVNMFLQTLYQDRLITFHSEDHAWTWDLEAIKKQAITDNVVEFMIARILKLSPAAQKVLSLAAAIGNQFDVCTLSLAYESPSHTLFPLVWLLLRERLIVPLNENYKYLEDCVEASQTVPIRFLHDRVQQAAYALIPDQEKPKLHIRIGRILLHHQPLQVSEEALFTIVDHLNKGQSFLEDVEEREQLAKLNLRAAQKAKAASAYGPALEYIILGLVNLEPSLWECDYSFMFSYYLEKGEIEFLNAKWDQAIETFEYALEHTRSLLDRAKIQEKKVGLYYLKADLRASLDIGLQALADLGLHLPAFPTEEESDQELLNLETLLEECNIDGLFDLPEMNDQEKLASLVLLRECFSPACDLGSRLGFIIPIKMTEITINGGNNPHAVVGYILLAGITLAPINEDFRKAYQFGRLALKLNEETYQVKAYEAVVAATWGGWISHYTEHIDQSKAYIMKAYNSGVENGNYHYAGFTGMDYVFMNYWGPTPLPKVSMEIAKIFPVLSKINPTSANHVSAIRVSVFNLIHFSEDPSRLSEEMWPHMDEVIQQCTESDDLYTLFVIAVCRLCLANWFVDPQRAFDYSESAEKFLGAASSGLFINAVFLFHQCLALSASYRTASGQEKIRFLEKIKANERKFTLWSQHAPSTYLHQLLFIQAELARITGEDLAAMDLYERAITSAQENQFRQNQAFACERYGQFLLAKNKPKFAMVYLKEAYLVYEQWGAIAKLESMRQMYVLSDAPGVESSTSSPFLHSATTVQYENAGLDLMTIIKSFQVLSEEMQLDRLLASLMRYAMENAGAEKGLLLLAEGPAHELRIQAKSFSRDHIEVLTGENFEDSTDLSQEIVSYVARSREPVVLGEATQEGLFIHDPYIQQAQPKSILCLPLLRQATLVGILYFENNLASNAFIHDGLELLKLLASQAAISIAQAQLYTSLQSSEKKFRRLAESNIIGVFFADTDHAIYEANEAFLSMTGYEQADLPLDWRAMTPSEWVSRDEVALGELAHSGVIEGFEKTFLRKDGEPVPVFIGAAALHDPPTAIVCFVLDLTERKQAEKSKEVTEQQLREMLYERTRISQDLHDHILQSVYAVGLIISAAKQLISTGIIEVALGYLEQSITQLNITIEEIRVFIEGLPRESVDIGDFSTELSALVRTMNLPRLTEFDVNIDPMVVQSLTKEETLHLLSIARESMNNCMRHANASKGSISLTYHSGEVRFEIQDNGIGFSYDASSLIGHGLKNMQARVQQLHGKLHVCSQIGQGTKIVVELPKGNVYSKSTHPA